MSPYGKFSLSPGTRFELTESSRCAAVIGFVTAIVCASLENLNEWMRIDDGLEVFKLHGIGGMCGSFMTGIFASASVSALDGVTLAPGGIDGNGIQVAKQLAEITAISAWSFTVTAILLMIMKFIPGMHLRVSDEAESIGMDLDQFYDEQIGDWSLFDQAVMLPAHGKEVSAPPSPPGEVKEPGESTEDV